MKKYLLLLFCFFSIPFFGQQLPQSSLYFINDLALNPAVAGSKEYIPILLSHRTQWANFKNAPSTQMFSAHGTISKMGIGLQASNFTAGPTGIISVQLAYSYKVKLNEKNTLSLGLAPMYMQYALAKEKIKLDETNDLTFGRVNSRTSIADCNTGLYFQGKNYSAGISALQLLGSKFRTGDSLSNERLRRHFALSATYDFKLNERMVMSPVVIAKAIESGAPYQVDGTVKFMYDNSFWAGLGYRASFNNQPNDAAIVCIGLQRSGFVFAYAFDYSLNTISSYSYGSHELLLSYRLSGKKAESKPMN